MMAIFKRRVFENFSRRVSEAICGGRADLAETRAPVTALAVT